MFWKQIDIGDNYFMLSVTTMLAASQSFKYILPIKLKKKVHDITIKACI